MNTKNNELGVIAGISGLTIGNIQQIFPKYCNIPRTEKFSIIINKILFDILNKFVFIKEKQEVSIQANEIKSFDDNFSVRLREDGCIEVIEHIGR